MKVIAIGSRVIHRNSKKSFGRGTVLEINTIKKTVLVEWDTHEVARRTKELKRNQSHVSLKSLQPK